MAFAGNIAVAFNAATECSATKLRERLNAAGFAVEDFTSGVLMEAAIRAKQCSAIIDFAIDDLAADVPMRSG